MLIHTGDKTHKCTMCGNNFREKGGLSKQMKIHSGDKPYECRTCGQSFKR